MKKLLYLIPLLLLPLIVYGATLFQSNQIIPSPYLGIVVGDGNGTHTLTGSSTPFTQGIISVNSTSSQATTSYLNVSTLASTSLLTVTGLGNSATVCLQITNQGIMQATAAACGSGSGSTAPNEFSYVIANNGNYLTPTSTAVGILTVGSSTAQLLSIQKSTTTQATTTYLNASTLATLAKVGIGTTTSDLLAIQGDYPAFRVFNTASTQYAGAGFYLINTTASMGNQAGAVHYMGINDGSATQGYYTIDKTNVTGGGTGHLQLFDYNADSVNFYTNSAIGARLYPPNSQGSIFEITPPTSPNNQEATVATTLKDGSGNNEWVDWTMENYSTDHQGSINVSKAGTGAILPFSLRFWDNDKGTIANVGVYSQTWLPNGTIGFGVSTSTAGTTTNPALLYAASSTATNLLRLDAAAGAQKFLVTSAGIASTTNLTISGLGNTATNCLQITNQGVVQSAGSACGGATPTVPNEFTYVQANNGNYLTPTSTTVGILTAGSSTISNIVSLNSTSSQATSTYLNVTSIASTSILTVSNTRSALMITGASGIVSGYSGTSCTNQFPRSLNALGAATCATVANTDLANSTISGIALGSNLANLTATDGTLTFSGTYTGASAQTIGLNLANANTWSALQTHTAPILVNNATSTIANLVMINSTSTQATTTYANISTLASTSALTVSNAATIGGTLTVSALSTLNGGILGNAASSTITNLVMVNSTTTQATTTYLAVSTIASTSKLTVSNQAGIGAAPSTRQLQIGGTKDISFGGSGTNAIYFYDDSGNNDSIWIKGGTGLNFNSYPSTGNPIIFGFNAIEAGRFYYRNTNDYSFSLGSTTPFALLSLTGNTKTIPFAISTTTSTLASSTLFMVDQAGDIHLGGGTPTLSSCGTAPTLDANSTDQAGTITFGASASGCTLTFSVAKASIPHCVWSTQAVSLVNAITFSETASAITFTQAASGGVKFDYICALGH